MRHSPTDSPLTVLRDPPSGRKVWPRTWVNIVVLFSYLNDYRLKPSVSFYKKILFEVITDLVFIII